jgi:hypothetical protein
MKEPADSGYPILQEKCVFLNTCFTDVLKRALPSSQINLHCLSAEISDNNVQYVAKSIATCKKNSYI